jgi:purine-nucleoside phosphorylase
MNVAPLGIVAGSGIALESLLDEVVEERSFHDVLDLTPGGIEGHPMKFLRGACGPYPVILQCGRLHFYEGLRFDEIVRPLDIMLDYGARTILLANAAGGLKPGMMPGDLVAVDRVRLCRYQAWAATPGMLFPDFLVPDCEFVGTYQWVYGPSYETRAEIAAIQRLGAHAVGMSAAPELMHCQAKGGRAGIVCCITNSCCRPQVLTHADVVTQARKASSKLARVIRRALPALAAGPHQ